MYESVDCQLKKETIVGIVCWELKHHLFKVLIPPTFAYDANILRWGWIEDGENEGEIWKNPIGKGMWIHRLF